VDNIGRFYNAAHDGPRQLVQEGSSFMQGVNQVPYMDAMSYIHDVAAVDAGVVRLRRTGRESACEGGQADQRGKCEGFDDLRALGLIADHPVRSVLTVPGEQVVRLDATN